MNEDLYTLNIDHARKVVSFVFRGTPNVEDVTEFHHHYLKTISPIETAQYLLILDGTQMSVPETERLHQMQVSFALYRKSGFQQIAFILSNDEMRRKILKPLQFSGMSDVSDISFITPEEVEDIVAAHVAKNQ